MDNLPDDTIGKWTRLGCRIALVGERGTVEFDDQEHLARFLRVTVPELDMIAQRVPGIVIETPENRHGKLTVTMKNWTKYQEDSTQAARAKASRSKRRGEEIRREVPPKPPGPLSLSRVEKSEPSLGDFGAVLDRLGAKVTGQA